MRYTYSSLLLTLTALISSAQAQRADEGNREMGRKLDGQATTGSPYLLPGWAWAPWPCAPATCSASSG